MGFWSDLFGCKDMQPKQPTVVKEEIVKKVVTQETLSLIFDKTNLVFQNEEFIYQIYYSRKKYLDDLYMWSGVKDKEYTLKEYDKKSFELKNTYKFTIERVLGRKNTDTAIFVIKENNDCNVIENALTLTPSSLDEIALLYKSSNLPKEFYDETNLLFDDVYKDDFLKSIKCFKNSKFGNYVFNIETKYKYDHHIGGYLLYIETCINTVDEDYTSHPEYNHNLKKYYILNRNNLELEELDYDVIEKYGYIIDNIKRKEATERNNRLDEEIDYIFEDYDTINKNLNLSNTDLLMPIKTVEHFKDFINLRDYYSFVGMHKERKYKYLINDPTFIERIKFRLESK